MATPNLPAVPESSLLAVLPLSGSAETSGLLTALQVGLLLADESCLAC